jgi:hypothetical protein
VVSSVENRTTKSVPNRLRLRLNYRSASARSSSSSSHNCATSSPLRPDALAYNSSKGQCARYVGSVRKYGSIRRGSHAG